MKRVAIGSSHRADWLQAVSRAQVVNLVPSPLGATGRTHKAPAPIPRGYHSREPDAPWRTGKA